MGWVRTKWAATDSWSSGCQSLYGDSQGRTTSGKREKDKRSIDPPRNQLLGRESDSSWGQRKSWNPSLRVTRSSSPRIKRPLSGRRVRLRQAGESPRDSAGRPSAEFRSKPRCSCERSAGSRSWSAWCPRAEPAGCFSARPEPSSGCACGGALCRSPSSCACPAVHSSHAGLCFSRPPPRTPSPLKRRSLHPRGCEPRTCRASARPRWRARSCRPTSCWETFCVNDTKSLRWEKDDRCYFLGVHWREAHINAEVKLYF